MNAVLYEKRIPVRHSADICIVGAGPAGIAAAVSAARAGGKVYLAEAHSCSGGLGTAGLVPVFMPFSDGIHFLAGGIGREVNERLNLSRGSVSQQNPNGIDAEKLKCLYETMLIEAGVEFTYHTVLFDVIKKDNRIETAFFTSPGGAFAVNARVFIDATGSGHLSVLAGAEYAKGDDNGRMMPATLCSLWCGIDWEEFLRGGARSHNDEKMPELIRRAVADGVLSLPDYHHTGMSLCTGSTFGGNFLHCFDTDPDDEISQTAAYVRGRRLLTEYEAFYRDYVPGCSQIRLVESGSLLGVREGRRIIGDYILNFADYRARRSFSDEIGRYNFSVDIHPSQIGMEATRKHKEEFRNCSCGHGESYGIPYRILLPRGIDGLLTAGRCVSTDRKVFASLRVMPGCFITGMAAGTAAALAVKNNCFPRDVDVSELQNLLQQNGAYLPNHKTRERVVVD